MSGANGEFTVQGLPPGRYRMSIMAKGHGVGSAAEVIEIAEDGTSSGDPDPELSQQVATVSGFVSDALGGAVAGAEVRAITSASPQSTGVRSAIAIQANADGYFELDVPPGRVSLIAVADGYAPGRATRMAPAEGVRLVMAPASSIHGVAVAYDTGRPIAGATVLARASLVDRREAVSDHSGRFAIDALPPGSYSIEASASGWRGRAPNTVALQVGDRVDGVVVTMHGASRVEGVLLAGAEVCPRGAVQVGPAGPDSASVPQSKAITDTEGRVIFEALPPGRYAVTLTCDGYGFAAGPALEVGAQDQRDVVWRLDAGAQLRVRAIDERAEPVAGIQLRVAPAGVPLDTTSLDRLRQGTTDEAGLMTLKGMAIGTYDISGRYLLEPVAVTLSADELRTVDVLVEATGGALIRVSDPDGRPLQEVTVSVQNLDGTPGALAMPIGGGEFRAGPLQVGDYQVSVRDAVNPRMDFPERLTVSPGEETSADIVYGGYSGEISGRILIGDDRPAEDVWVSAAAAGQRPDPYADVPQVLARVEGKRALTDTEGRFRLTGLNTTGRYSILAERPAGGKARLDNVAPGADDVVVMMAEPGSLAGRVVLAGGQPVSAFGVLVRNATTGEVMPPRTYSERPDGVWSMAEVGAGTLEITGRDPLGRTGTVHAELPPGGTLSNIELRLTQAHPGDGAPPGAVE